MSHPLDDLPRDPWLQAALRQAPDHDVAVPEAVRDTILTAARAAVRRPHATPPRRWWQGWWPQTAPTRLGYSGALMALLVVGLWGMDQLRQPAGTPESRPDLTAPAAPQVGAAAAPALPAPEQASPPAPMAAAAPATVPPQTRARATPPAKAVQPQVTEQPSQAKAPEPAAADQATTRERATRTTTPAADATPAAPPAPVAVAAAAAAVAPAPAPVHARPAVVAEEAPPQRNEAASQVQSRKAAAPAPNPLTQAQLALRTQADLRWLAATGQQGGHGPTQEAWLNRLQQAVSSPWLAAVRPAGPPTVQWPGTSETQLWLDVQGRVWLARGGLVHNATLPAPEAAALLGQLADWR